MGETPEPRGGAECAPKRPAGFIRKNENRVGRPCPHLMVSIVLIFNRLWHHRSRSKSSADMYLVSVISQAPH